MKQGLSMTITATVPIIATTISNGHLMYYCCQLPELHSTKKNPPCQMTQGAFGTL
jgi:hypothetical protein